MLRRIFIALCQDVSSGLIYRNFFEKSLTFWYVLSWLNLILNVNSLLQLKWPNFNKLVRFCSKTFIQRENTFLKLLKNLCTANFCKTCFICKYFFSKFSENSILTLKNPFVQIDQSAFSDKCSDGIFLFSKSVKKI